MLRTAIRSQANVGSLAVRCSRTMALSTSRNLSSLLARQVSVGLPAALSSMVVSRSFSRSAVAYIGHSVQPNEPSPVLFVGNLPWSATKEEMQELFGQFGEVVSVRLHTHADGRPRGFGHVQFTSKDHAIACFTSAIEEPLYFAGRDLVIDYAKDYSQRANNTEPNNRLYFVGCAEGEDAMKQIFSGHTENIVSIFFLRDGNTGDRIDRGFIEFKNVASATEALDELNGVSTRDGENLILSYARPPKPRSDRPRNPRLASAKREKYTSRSWVS